MQNKVRGVGVTRREEEFFRVSIRRGFYCRRFARNALNRDADFMCASFSARMRDEESQNAHEQKRATHSLRQPNLSQAYKKGRKAPVRQRAWHVRRA